METSSSSSLSSSSSINSIKKITFYDFLDRMRHPSSLDLVRSIKSFIVSFQFHAPNAENDGKRLQEFLVKMESVIREHPLWVRATEEEFDRAIEGLEQYVTTKLFSRTFASSPEDAKIDRQISEKTILLQNFLRPEHLDIPPVLNNEASLLLAENELQKINDFKAPREKLLCILKCVRVINNLLLDAAISENHEPVGADEFLPILVFVTIKANPLQLHSNLKYIQLYRRQAKLVSEAEYFLTSLEAAKKFILNLDAKELSINEIEFEESMKAAALAVHTGIVSSTERRDNTTNIDEPDEQLYPFMEAEASQLTAVDVAKLLSLYKDMVTRYRSLHVETRINVERRQKNED